MSSFRQSDQDVSSIRDVTEGEWNDIGRDHRTVYSTHQWLSFVEASMPPASFHYLLSRDSRGRLIAGLPLSWSEDEKNLNYASEYLTFDSPPGGLLVAGPRRGYANDLAANGGADAGVEYLDELLSRASEVAAANGLTCVLVPYLSAKDAATVHRMRPDSQVKLLDCNMTLEIPESTDMTAFAATLGGRRAYSIRKEIGRFDSSRLVSSIESLGDSFEEVGPLVSNVQRKHGSNESPAACVASLRVQAQFLDQEGLVFTARAEGKLVACALYYVWNQVLYGRMFGLDYDSLEGADEYFNTYYYQPIEYGISRGYRAVEFGRRSETAKSRRGAHGVTRWAVQIGGPGPMQQWRRTNTELYTSMVDGGLIRPSEEDRLFI